MDFPWLDRLSDEIHRCTHEKKSFHSDDYRAILRKYSREFWAKGNPSGDESFPRTLLDAEEAIDELLGAPRELPSVVHLVDVEMPEIKQIFLLFYAALVRHIGDSERCAAFILRYQDLAALLLVEDLAKYTIAGQPANTRDEVAKDYLRVFFPGLGETQLSKLTAIVRGDFLMKDFPQWSLDFFTGMATSVAGTSKIPSPQQSKFEPPEGTDDFLYRKSRFSLYSTASRAFPSKRPGGNVDSAGHKPSTDLFDFYLGFLTLDPADNPRIDSERLRQIHHDTATLVRQCHHTRLFSGCAEWTNAYDAYMAWEPAEKWTSMFASALAGKNAFSESMGKRAAYEKSLRKGVPGTNTWIEYIMWELHTSHELYLELISKGLCSSALRSCVVRPIVLCERALTSITHVNFGKELLSRSLADTQARDPGTLQTNFTRSWNACGPTLKELFGNDRLDAEAFRGSFRESGGKSTAVICTLTSCLPIWIQYMAVYRLLWMRRDRGCFRLTFLGSEIETRYVVPSLISRAMQTHPESMELLSECVFLAYYYQKVYALYGCVKQEKIPATSPAFIAKALLNSKILCMVLSNLNTVDTGELDASGLVHSPRMLSFLPQFEGTPRLRTPLHQIQQNLIVLLYLIGSQRIVGSLSFVYSDGPMSDETAEPSFRVVLSDYIASTLQALRKAINIQNEFFQTTGASKIETHEVSDTIKLVVLATECALRNLEPRRGSKLSEAPSTILKGIAKELTQIVEVSLYGYDKASYLDILDILYQTYDENSDELRHVYSKLVLQKVHWTSKTHRKSKPSGGCYSELVNRTGEYTLFFNSVLSLFSAIQKRMSWEAMRHFRCLKKKLLEWRFILFTSGETDNAQTWQTVMTEGMKNWIETSDDIRVCSQKVDMDLWISSRGNFFFQIDLPEASHGTPYVCVRNIPAPFDGVEISSTMDSHIVDSLLLDLKNWLLPFTSVEDPLFLFQKKQAIALIRFQSSSEALQCATSKNRSTWKTVEKVRTISVIHVKSAEELKKIQESFDRKKRIYPEGKNSHGQKKTKLERNGKDNHTAKSNDYFATLFSKGG